MRSFNQAGENSSRTMQNLTVQRMETEEVSLAENHDAMTAQKLQEAKLAANLK